MEKSADIRIAKNTVIIYIRMAMTSVLDCSCCRRWGRQTSAFSVPRESPLNKPHGLQKQAIILDGSLLVPVFASPDAG